MMSELKQARLYNCSTTHIEAGLSSLEIKVWIPPDLSGRE